MAYLGVVGDSMGEQHHIARGRYDAWLHVGIAFLYEILMLGGAVWVVLDAIGVASAVGETPALATAGVIGLAGSIVVFWNRWRTIEAFSSRFCSGLANLSMIYVPFVAFIYANVRGVQKLRGR